MDLKYRFIDTIKKYKMLNSGDKVLIGVSGGPDSICLLHLLWRVKDELNIEIAVAHLDHMFRGYEAQQDAIFVKRLCEEMDVEFFTERIDVPKYIENTGYSPEDAARRIRYKFFEKVKSNIGATKIALGHNRNDHEETVLMNILRGSGLEGLIGIEPVRGCYIRPILEFSRDEIEQYITEQEIGYRIDRTNLTSEYFRNKLRLELIPLIKNEYCPHFGSSLRRLSEIAKTDISFIENEVEKVWKDVVTQENNKIIFDLNKFLPLHEAIKRRIVRKAVELLSDDLKDFEYKHTLMVVDFIKNAASGSNLDLPKNLIGEKRYNKFALVKGPHRPSVNYCYDLSVPGKVYINEVGLTIEAALKIRDSNYQIKADPLIAQLDYDKIIGNLVIRNRKPGDRFFPLGFAHEKKLKDFFSDEKIPKEKRDQIPLVINNNQIVWIAGMRIDDRFKITDHTKNILILKIKR